MAQDTPISDNRGERILAFMIASAVGLSIIAFLTIIIGTATGVTNFGEGLWPVAIVLPSIGLPIGLILMIVLIVKSGLRRGRETRDAGN
ncbi:multidrug ABC transporter ATPase [Salinibacterium sp. G-O1]|uniref:multidrug ABC transporter ATPase n=1 Tax=Salinibacterium sp. G-O1 TaxID=3046208 RepID=UPI0024B923B6|nr:multidrug ABC transporter ATPase [Salinibacterium sp. G-O1]MDJ0336072.1 multidrug ABC transporter ATPase [Salinibacterium sp. G-O1]